MADTERSFQQVYNAFQIKILRYLTRLVGEGEAEDLSQEVFTKVAQGLPDFRGEASLSTWIYKIATNSAYDRLRRSHVLPVIKNSTPAQAMEESEDDELCLMDKGEGDAEEKVIRQEMNGCIREIIDSLPESYRSVIILSDLEGISDREIAYILDLSLSAAKIRLHRARSILKGQLQRACVFYRDGRNELACDRRGNGADHPDP